MKNVRALRVNGSAASPKAARGGLAILFATSLAGCALLPIGAEDSDPAGNGSTTIRLAGSNGKETDWSVADRADANKVLVSLTTGRALGLSIAGSMVLSPSAFLPQPADYQQAAVQFLTQTDRAACRITAISKTAQFQYEFKYDCADTASPIVPSRGR
jgi:hypothetical protein